MCQERTLEVKKHLYKRVVGESFVAFATTLENAAIYYGSIDS